MRPSGHEGVCLSREAHPENPPPESQPVTDLEDDVWEHHDPGADWAICRACSQKRYRDDGPCDSEWCPFRDEDEGGPDGQEEDGEAK